MIEIKCTEEQKKLIIDAIDMIDACTLLDINKCDDIYRHDCHDCIEQNIKWDIQPELLKPCPCCGGTAGYAGYTNNTYVRCKSCHMQTIGCETEKEATERWNRRITS